MAVLTAVIVIILVFLCSCGKQGPSQEDAENYVKAVLDIMCTGQYDTSVNISDLEEGKEMEFRDEMIDEMLASFEEETGMDEDVQKEFREYLISAFSKCKYTIDGAVKTEDGGYDVKVSIEPLLLFNGTSEALQTELDTLTEDTDKLLNMPEEEVYDFIYDAMFRVLNANLESPAYGDAEIATVHYGIIDQEENAYGLDEEAGELLGEKLFSLDGLE